MTVQTTTAKNACNAQIWLDDNGGTPRNLSGQTTVVTPNFDQPSAKFYTLGTKSPKRLQCPIDASYAVQSVYTTASNEAREIIFDWWFNHRGDSRTLTLYTPTKDVGADKIEGNFKLENFTFSASAGEAAPMIVSYTLTIDGDLTWSIAAT